MRDLPEEAGPERMRFRKVVMGGEAGFGLMRAGMKSQRRAALAADLDGSFANLVCLNSMGRVSRNWRTIG